MGKRETLANELSALLRAARGAEQPEALFSYLLRNSALPGPRANLELLWAFGDAVAGEATGIAAPWLVSLCERMAAVSSENAPVNTPEVFVPLCGAVGLGRLGAQLAVYRQPALARLRELARDSRWRMREGVCFALQALLSQAPNETLAMLENWVAGGDWLEMRAAAAALADPDLLQSPAIAESAIALHQGILTRFTLATDRKAEAFRVLRQGLAYTLSLVVKALPERGFPWLRELLEGGDPDVVWVVKQNLQKNRLVSAFPDEVAALSALGPR
jgi:hypothetical protein